MTDEKKRICPRCGKPKSGINLDNLPFGVKVFYKPSKMYCHCDEGEKLKWYKRVFK